MVFWDEDHKGKVPFFSYIEYVTSVTLNVDADLDHLATMVSTRYPHCHLPASNIFIL